MNTPLTPQNNIVPESQSWLRKAFASPLGLAMLLFTVHGMNDQYGSYLGALMPVLMKHFGITLGMAGVMAGIASLSTSLFQPVFGYLLDKSPKPPSIFVWPVITAVSTCLIGLAPGVLLVIPLLIVGGLSTAAFHPHASSMVPKTSSAGLATALFIAGGTFGYAIGPVASLWVVERFSISYLWILAVPTVVVSLAAMRAMPRKERPIKPGDLFSLRVDKAKLKTLLAIWSIVALRSTVGTAYATFLSVHLNNTGFPLARIGFALLVYTMAGAFGSIAGGAYSDRFGRKTAITTGLLGILPSYLVLLQTTGVMTWVMLIIAGFTMQFFNPVTVVMAQDLFPRNRGAAAGMIMGLGWSIGGFLVSIVGAAADKFGLVRTLTCVSLLIVPALLISLTLPGKYMQRQERNAVSA